MPIIVQSSSYGHYACPAFCISSVQFSHSVMSDSLRPHESQHARPPCPSPTPGVHSTHVHSVSDAIQPSHPLSSPSPPAPNLIRVFSNESTLHMRWPKYWSFSFSSIPSKEIPGLISFRMDWLDLLRTIHMINSFKSLRHHYFTSKFGYAAKITIVLHK